MSLEEKVEEMEKEIENRVQKEVISLLSSNFDRDLFLISTVLILSVFVFLLVFSSLGFWFHLGQKNN